VVYNHASSIEVGIECEWRESLDKAGDVEEKFNGENYGESKAEDEKY
jgi:hypothetical protein